MSCDEISADWAAQRIKGLDLGSAIRNALTKSLSLGTGKKKDGAVIKTLIESFQYPRKGPGMMWEAARDKILAQGGKIQMSATLERLVWDNDRKIWTATLGHADGRKTTITARQV